MTDYQDLIYVLDSLASLDHSDIDNHEFDLVVNTDTDARCSISIIDTACQSSSAITCLQAELNKATRALTRAGYTLVEGAQEWKPPIGPSASPLLDRINQLLELLSESRRSVDYQMGMQRSDTGHRETFADLLNRIDAALAGTLPERQDTEWTDAASTPTAQDYRELQSQHDQLQSKYKAAMDVLRDLVELPYSTGGLLERLEVRERARDLLAGQAPMPEPAPVVPDELDYDVELESGEYDHELDEPFLRGRVQGWNDCRSAMLAAAHKPEGSA